jgi:hypothetical protein
MTIYFILFLFYPSAFYHHLDASHSELDLIVRVIEEKHIE